MDKQTSIAPKFSEFSYSEDTQMALDDALYANDFSFDGVKELAIDSAIKVLFIPLVVIGAPHQEVYAESNMPRVEQTDYHKVDIEESQVDAPVIEESADEVVESPYAIMTSFVRNLSTLPSDLPGLDFEVPSEEIAGNAVKFLEAMDRAGIACPESGCVMPTAFGTIVIDATVERGLVSMEIGRTKVGFFTDYEDGINEESDGLSTDFTTIPEPLLNHLTA